MDAAGPNRPYPNFAGYPRLNAVAAIGNDFVVVGSTDDSNGNYTGMVLTSIDGGRTWQQDGSATLAGWQYWNVAAAGSTIVVIGQTSAAHETAFITSHDSGQTWSQPHDPDGVLVSNSALALVATDTDFRLFIRATSSETSAIDHWRGARTVKAGRIKARCPAPPVCYTVASQ